MLNCTYCSIRGPAPLRYPLAPQIPLKTRRKVAFKGHTQHTSHSRPCHVTMEGAGAGSEAEEVAVRI